MSRIILSVCIATLNRAKFIGETLESIVSQITNEVEIVVVDGASTDNTGEVVQRFATRFQNLRYVRLVRKGGVDKDYDHSVEQAKGLYCWLFTDDDIMKPGAIAKVLEATRQNYSLIVVNAEVRDGNLQNCLMESRLKQYSDTVYLPEDHGRLFTAVGNYLSFIGGVVIRREVWNQRERVKYFGSLFIHLGVIFQQPLPRKALVLAYPWIIIRYGNAQWTSRSFEIWMFKFPDLIWSFPHLEDDAKASVEERNPWRQWTRLLMNRATGHYSIHDYDKWLKSRLPSGLHRTAARLIAITPVLLLNQLARFYLQYVVRTGPCMTLFDLEQVRVKI